MTRPQRSRRSPRPADMNIVSELLFHRTARLPPAQRSATREHIAMVFLPGRPSCDWIERHQSLDSPIRVVLLKTRAVLFKDSSVESMGEFRFRELAKCVIEREFGDAKSSEAIGFSHGDFGFVVQTLDHAAGELLFSLEVIEN